MQAAWLLTSVKLLINKRVCSSVVTENDHRALLTAARQAHGYLAQDSVSRALFDYGSYICCI